MECIKNKDIVIENEQLRLVVGSDCLVKSLLCKATGEECAEAGEEISLISVTQERPFNNEVKLSHPNKRTTYQGCCLRREGDELIVGFEIAPYKARIGICEKPGYVGFKLIDFIVGPEDYGHLAMDLPPAVELRLLQLPVKHRKNFGEWLNVVWDDKALVNVLGTSPYTVIDSERRKSCRILYADATRESRMQDTGAALICCAPKDFLDIMDGLEADFGLPRGAQSRRSQWINRSAYWTSDINPENVDRQIAYAKQGGFTMMLIYYTAMFKTHAGYDTCGNYDFRPEYPGGYEDLKKMLAKIKAAGITPGFHFLQTHIGTASRYVTPVLDHRLNKTRRFTLARPLGLDDDTVYVEENPEGAVMNQYCRVLGFGGEAIYYEGYTTEWPYRFTGCKRGHYDTNITEHPAGQVGGTLDVSEFGRGTSIYIDQRTSLQDEIADKIAAIYNCGFQYCYFDGSEGATVPFGIHVPNAQYRVCSKFEPAPLYTEGAAKAHFGWHFLSGGNAFDIFSPEEFKAKIVQHPAEEAPRMRQDFTRLNFGWWGFWAPGDVAHATNGQYNTVTGTQADMFEYGTAQAAAWDCPITIQTRMQKFEQHPRFADIFEVMRRWEDVRQNGFLTEERKEMLKNPDREHILLINEKGEYELVPYDQIKAAAGGDPLLRAFVFERCGASWVTYWHSTGAGKLFLPLKAADICVYDALGGEALPVEEADGGIVIPAENRRYLRSTLSREALVKAFEQARYL